jgi:putative polyhydroxyalkanoate system protein
MSKPVIVNLPHELGRAEARRRLEGGFGRIRDQIGVKALAFTERWEGDRMHFDAGAMGQKVTGRVEVFDKSVRIEVDLPWFLAAIAQKIQGRVQNAGTLLLEKK